MVVANGWWLAAPPAPTYADVPDGSPFFAYVETLTAHHLADGYPCGAPTEPCDAQNHPYYRPLGTTSRAQAARLVDGVRLDSTGKP